MLLVGVSASGGVATRNLIERGLADQYRVVALTYDAPLRPLPLDVPTVRGDGRRLPLLDDSVDYVFSNAVIEHLGGREGARQLIAESLRVARRGVIHTTPNRWFPVETHTSVPLLHWLPRRFQETAFRRVGKHFPTSSYWLMSRRDLRRLMPARTRIESVGRMSLVAITRVEPAGSTTT